jgi:hypothetical protein
MLKILSGHAHLIPGGKIFQHKFIGFIELIGIGDFLHGKETPLKGFLPRVSPQKIHRLMLLGRKSVQECPPRRYIA